MSRPGLVKDRSLFCCLSVLTGLPDSTALRGSESGSGELCGSGFWRDKEGRVKMGFSPQTLGQPVGFHTCYQMTPCLEVPTLIP